VTISRCVDNVVTGVKQVWTGEEQHSATGFLVNQVATSAGATPDQAETWEAVGEATTDLLVGFGVSRALAAPGVVAEDELLRAARAARDAKAAEVGRVKATVTGGYHPPTGRVVSGCSSNPFGCAEDDVVRQLDVDPTEVRFTEAIRPRTGEEVPICARCQKKYTREQFPEEVEWKEGGPWDDK